MSEPESPANSTHKCFPPRAPQEGPPLFQHGNIVFQAHDVGWIVTAFFTIIATVTSFWLINKHLQWYTNKAEQRYIVRLLFMVPIYANISLASYLFWNHSTPLLLLRDAYEAILLTAFFYLLLTYLSPNPDEQKAIFRREGLSRENDQARERRGLPPKKWVFPLSFVKWKPQDGLYFLQLMKYGVLQYCVVRPVTTFFAVVLNYIGWYCETSWSPAWGHIWITGLISISVTIGMYCLLQLYLSVATELVPYRPVLKLFAVKAVVFLTFWQATFLSLLTMFGVVKDTPYMTAEDINIGWGAILETFEMTLFAFLHIKAFSYKPYRRADEPRTPRFRSLFHAMDFRDTFRELGAGWVYMWRRMRGIETDTLARREAAFENVSGKTRMRPARDLGEKKGVGVAVDSVTEVNGERQWLGVGDEYGYGLGRRERSEAFNVQVEKELTKKGYSMQAYNSASRLDDSVLEDAAPVRRHRSLWRRVYDRVSQTNADANVNVLSPSPRRGPSRRQPAEQRALIYDDLPPPSIMRTYRDRRSSRDLSSAPMPTALPLSSDWYAPPAMPPIAESSSNPPPLVRSDSLFGRLFPHGLPESERSHSVQSAVPPPSSQSHHTQVRLNPPWESVPQSSGAGRMPEREMPHAVSVESGHVSPVYTPAPPSPSDSARRTKPRSRSRPRQQEQGDVDERSRRSSHRRESANAHSTSQGRSSSGTRPFEQRERSHSRPRAVDACLPPTSSTYAFSTSGPDGVLPSPSDRRRSSGSRGERDRSRHRSVAPVGEPLPPLPGFGQ